MGEVEGRGSRVESGAGPAKPERSEVRSQRSVARPGEVCFALHGPRVESRASRAAEPEG